ncbi:YdcF family protein [Leuconostoc litchii]|nr:YdcF family protein [Leuconostoc litchii]
MVALVILLFLSVLIILYPQTAVGTIIYRNTMWCLVLSNVMGLILVLNLSYYSYHSWQKWHHAKSKLILSAMLILYVATDLVVLIAKVFWLPSIVLVSFVISGLASYVFCQFLCFVISSLFYGLVIKKPARGPLVVLGGGLVDGRFVGRIVGNRIKAAIEDANSMVEYPLIIFSGGQGPDEKVTEAQAMRDFAVQKYQVPLEKTLLEDQSRNTYENLRNTDKLINKSFTFYTSEYHVLRGALLTKKLGISAQGRGGHTRLSYRTVAFIREFAGVMSLYQREHVIFATIWALISLLVVLIKFI